MDYSRYLETIRLPVQGSERNLEIMSVQQYSNSGAGFASYSRGGELGSRVQYVLMNARIERLASSTAGGPRARPNPSRLFERPELPLKQIRVQYNQASKIIVLIFIVLGCVDRHVRVNRDFATKPISVRASCTPNL